MRRPWMPLYVADYLADTTHLSALESGVYLHLIMHYWLKGGLPDDDAQLARIAKLPLTEWAQVRPTIADLFGEGWSHARIDRELQEADQAYERRASAGRRSAQARAAKQSSNNAGTLSKQSQPQPQKRESEGGAPVRADAVVVVSRETPKAPISEQATTIATQILASKGLDLGSLEAIGLIYAVQGWLNEGIGADFILGRAIDLVSRKSKFPHVNYLSTAIRNAWAEEKERPKNAETSKRSAGSAAGSGWQRSRDDFRDAHAEFKRHIDDAGGTGGGGEEGGGPAVRPAATVGRG